MRRADRVKASEMGKVAAVLTLSLLVGAPALAQPPKPAAASSAAQAKLPYDITADHGEVFNDEHRAVYTGNVVVIQGADRLTTPKLDVYFAQKGGAAKPAKQAPAGAVTPAESFRKIERMEAEGPVYFTTPTQNAKGDHGTYLAADETTTLTGNVILVQDKDVSTGDKLVINRITDHYVMSSTGGGKQRVRGVFYQDDSKGQPGAASPPKSASKPGSAHP